MCWECLKAAAITLADIQAAFPFVELRTVGQWSPVNKTRFLEIAAEYGINRFLASDLWYFRPVDHAHDTEDEVRGNLELMKADGWIGRNNVMAENLIRHQYQRGPGGKCEFCNRRRLAAEHNTEPADQNPAAIAPKRLLT
jgi:hypothetical protein